jgi:hypothetical protein
MKVMDHDRLTKHDFLHLGILAGVGLLLGIYLIVSLPLIANDGVFYIEQAHRVVSDPLAVTRRHPPGYPFLVWVAHALTSRFAAGDSALLWARSAQGIALLCRVLALVPLYFLGKRLVGPRDSFLALLILILLPYPAYYGSDALREWPHVLFLSLGFWMLYRGLQEAVWWPFAGVGLAAGLGYLIRPECAQLLIYGALGLVLAARHPRWGHPALAGGPDDAQLPDEGGRAWAPRAREGRLPVPASPTADWRRVLARWGAGLLLMAGFAIPAVPCIRAVGSILPQQLSAVPTNAPPVILGAGSRPAGNEPLEFEVRAGQLLEVPVEAFDPEDQPLRFSLVGVPAGARPVYQFRSVATRAPFWTLSEDERSTLLTTYCPQVWQYDGVVCYAYARAGPPAGLQPVHRFWSPVRQRHLYTISDSEKETLRQAGAPSSDAARQGDDWQYEGVAFYVFPADNHPPDAVPVYRLGSERGIADCGLQIADSTRDANPQSEIVNPQSGQVAWYVPGTDRPPAGATIEDHLLRWQPRPDQQGEYQINIVVSDGQSSSCQLVKIRVQAPPAAGAENPLAGPAEMRNSSTDIRARSGGNSKFESRNPKQVRMSQIQNTSWRAKRGHLRRDVAGHSVSVIPIWDLFRISCFGFRASNSPCPAPGRQYAGVARLPKAADQLFDAIAEDLMVVFLVPWLLGLYYRLRYEAGRTERVLVAALLFVNLAAMLARYAWMAPGENRRYSLGLLALTIFYIPTGLQLLANWLARISEHGFRSADGRGKAARQANPQSSIRNLQSLLLAIGLGTCLFRFGMAPKVDKSSYRVMARWLGANTAPGAVVAVPDLRISFYAERPAVFYKRQFDPRRVDYAVRVEDPSQPAAPSDWRREYSLPFNRGKGGKTIVAYKISRSSH